MLLQPALEDSSSSESSSGGVGPARSTAGHRWCRGRSWCRPLLLPVSAAALLLLLFAPSSVLSVIGLSIASAFSYAADTPAPAPYLDAFTNATVERGRDADGVACVIDSCCRSDHCAGVPPFRVCVECTVDSHCPTFSQPFCFAHQCTTHKHGKPIGPEGYPIRVDGSTPTYVKRQPVEYSNVADILYRYPAGETSKMTVTATHVLIPRNIPFIFSWARGNRATGEFETGLSHGNWMENRFSSISDRAVIGLAEKSHTVSYKGGHWHTRSADRARSIIKHRSTLTNMIAARVREHRDAAVVGYVSTTNLGAMLVEAGQDVVNVEKVRAYAAAANGTRGVRAMVNSSRWRLLGARAHETYATVPNATSLKSENICLHLERAPGLTLTDTHFHIPLRQNIVAYRALVVNNPFRTFNSFTGVAVFDVNEAGELEVYHTASSNFLFQFDPWISHEGLLPSTLWVGPVDATDVVPSVDGRADRHAKPDSSIVIKSAWEALQAIPMDYERLWATDLCPASKQHFLRKTFVERATVAIREGYFAKGGGAKNWGGFGKNFWNGSLSVLGFGSVVSNSVDCGNSIIRSDWVGLNGFDVLEMTVWGHFFGELPVDFTMTAMVSKFWNDGIKLPS